MRKLRLKWLALAVAFGIGCNSALTPPDFPRIAALFAPAPVEVASVATPEMIAPDVPELAPVVAPVAEIVVYPRTEELVAANGDTFVTMLGKVGIPVLEAHNVLDAMGKKFNPRALGVNDKIIVTVDKLADAELPTLTALAMPVSNVSTLHVARGDKGDYKVSQVDVPVVKALARAGGKINSSLYETIISSGMPASMVGEIIKAYSYDVDFQREIRSGDSIDVVFEKKVTEDGRPVGFGDIIYASLDLGDRDLRIYRYTGKDGSSDYYNAKGESVRKALLRTPINGARISSGFGMRNHPILGYSKMHKGVDFAAVTGTPIYAAGDGVVAFVGRKGGYGNYLQIKHNAQYASAYAHLSRFATGVAPGRKVKQGQIVAYVGSTGASTGPHLHYEILMAGRQVNPANVKFKTGNVLSGKELAAFKRNVNTLQAQLDSVRKPSGKIAMLNIPLS
ncbi:MAG: peptidoglycan DD-metalloendopeptidase family protein [Alphaproteobacteria bacterium]|nr:peptidoglycan DD-metalloendopeptidase family protein [Alphaproteobacteria bacterium]